MIFESSLKPHPGPLLPAFAKASARQAKLLACRAEARSAKADGQERRSSEQAWLFTSI